MGRILVTGAGGALGRALVRRLSAEGEKDVVGLVRGETAIAGCRAVRGDVTTAPWRELLEGCSTVFHLAAFVHRVPGSREEAAQMRAVNHEATATLARACREAGARLVYASTVAVMGPGGEGLDETAPRAPASEYGRSKAQAEVSIEEEGRAGLRYAICRMPLLYGPHGRGNMERMLRAIAARRYWPVGNPATRKSCLHLDDAADALVRAASPAVGDGAFIVAPPESPTLGEIHQAAYQAVGRAAPRLVVPAGLARLAARAADVAARALGRKARFCDQVSTLSTPAWYDGGLFAGRTGFRPRVDLRTGLKETALWMAREGLLT
jgi:UDP-glucose 4-epimerase